jgi:hypothetical protein
MAQAETAMYPHNCKEMSALTAEDRRQAEETLIARAHEVVWQSTKRVRKVTEDTQTTTALPSDPTAEQGDGELSAAVGSHSRLRGLAQRSGSVCRG